MRETRLSGSEGGAGSIPVPTPILADPPSALRPEDGHTTVRSLRTAASRRARPSCTIAAVGPSIISPAWALVGICSGGLDRSAQPVDRPQLRWRERSSGHVRGVGRSRGPDFARTGDAGTGVITALRWRANERCFSGFSECRPGPFSKAARASLTAEWAYLIR